MPLTIDGVTHADGQPLTVGGVQVETVTAQNGAGGTPVVVWRNTSVPSKILDFLASNDVEGAIGLSWSPATGIPPEMTYAVWYDNAGTPTLILDGVTSPYSWTPPTDGNPYTCWVEATNAVGTTASNTEVGQSLIPKIPVVDFLATDDEQLQITMTFTADPGAVRYDLYMDGGLVTSAIPSGYVYPTAVPLTASFFVRGVYLDGVNIDSNPDTGVSLEEQDPAGSIEILATTAWSVPKGWTEINVCINGGGGGGTGSYSDPHGSSFGGGGGGSGAVSGLLTMAPEEDVIVTIGIGGTGGQLYSPAVTPTDGTLSSFGEYLVSQPGRFNLDGGSGGGAGGSGAYDGHAENGGNFSGCAGAFTGGLADQSYGAGGGGAGGYGNGGAGGNNGSAGTFGGGGGGGYILAGNGGAGRCYISWGI